MTIGDALDAMSKATGIKALIDAHQKGRRAVLAGRRAAHREGGSLGDVLHEAMRLWDIQTAEGVSREDRLSVLERTLRAAWPQTREWKFLCDDCSDRGLMLAWCPGDATCGRSKPHLPHEFGRPCWCAKGQAFREPAKTEESFKKAGKVSTPQPVGRW